MLAFLDKEKGLRCTEIVKNPEHKEARSQPHEVGNCLEYFWFFNSAEVSVFSTPIYKESGEPKRTDEWQTKQIGRV